MAELTKDQIKEALSFFGDFQKVFSFAGKAESAIAVLGQLNASVDSLGKKADGLRAEVAALEGQKTKFADERAAQKKELDTKRVVALGEIERESNNARMKTVIDQQAFTLKWTEDISGLERDKGALVQSIADLARDRDGIAADIAALKESQVTEQGRLDGILAKIAELKNRL